MNKLLGGLGNGAGGVILANPWVLLIIAIIAIILVISGVLVAVFIPGLIIGVVLWIFAYLIFRYIPISNPYLKWGIIIGLILAGVYIFANPDIVKLMVVTA